jgi:hypothetical protein
MRHPVSPPPPIPSSTIPSFRRTGREKQSRKKEEQKTRTSLLGVEENQVAEYHHIESKTKKKVVSLGWVFQVVAEESLDSQLGRWAEWVGLRRL